MLSFCAWPLFGSDTSFRVLAKSAMRVFCARSRVLRCRYIGCAFGSVVLLLTLFTLLSPHNQLAYILDISCKNDFSEEGMKKVVSLIFLIVTVLVKSCDIPIY